MNSSSSRNPEPLVTARLLRLPEVLKRVPLQKASLYRAVKSGHFPAPCKLLDARGSAWSEAEVNTWIASRLASRKVCEGL